MSAQPQSAFVDCIDLSANIAAQVDRIGTMKLKGMWLAARDAEEGKVRGPYKGSPWMATLLREFLVETRAVPEDWFDE